MEDTDEETVTDMDLDTDPEDEEDILAAVEEEVFCVSDKDNKMIE